MKVRCTECGKVVERPGPTESIGELDESHGVCDDCYMTYIDRLERELAELDFELQYELNE